MTCCTNERKKAKAESIVAAAVILDESKKGHMADALALGGDEGRDKLRKAAVRRK